MSEVEKIQSFTLHGSAVNILKVDAQAKEVRASLHFAGSGLKADQVVIPVSKKPSKKDAVELAAKHFGVVLLKALPADPSE